MDYRIEQVEDCVPIWDIYFGNKEVGVLTCFPKEGPMATVECINGAKITLGANTVALCAARAFDAHDAMMEALVIQEVGC